MRRRAVCALATALLLLCACSGGSTPGADGGDADTEDGAEAVVIDPPAPPDIPWAESGEPPVAPAVLSPCPPGWREVVEEATNVATCDPWPESGVAACAADEAHFPGEPGCTRIGTTCPAGDWADDLPADRPLRYVRAGAAPGGDGSAAAPFAAIAEAVAGATSGTIVALAKGSYDEEVRLPAGVTLWGACVAETTVTCSIPIDTAGTITVLGRDTEVRNLRVSGARAGIWSCAASRSVHLEDVLVEQATIMGVAACQGGSVTARTLVVRDTQPHSSRVMGRGLHAEVDGHLEVSRAVVERNRDVGVWVGTDGSSAVLEDVAIRDTQSRLRDLRCGQGVQAVDSGNVTVPRGVLEGNREVGAYADGAGSRLALTDTVVRDTLGTEFRDEVGRGVQAVDQATIALLRVTLDRNRLAGIFADGAGTTVTLADVVVRDTAAQASDRLGGEGLLVAAGAQATGERVVVERCRTAAIGAVGAGSSLVLADLAVRGTLPVLATGEGGRGAEVEAAGRLELTRALLEDNLDLGVLALDPGTVLVLADAAVRGTRCRESDRTFGWGLGVQFGARADLARCVFADNQHVALSAKHEGTRLTLADVVVRDTVSAATDGTGGVGLVATGGAQVEGIRTLFERNRETGVAAGLAGTALRLTDSEVLSTQQRACATTACPGDAAGMGVIVGYGAVFELTRFRISGNALCGIQLVDEASVDLHVGDVFANPIGANIQVPGFDPARLTDRVRYYDNERNLDMTELPVPDIDVPDIP